LWEALARGELRARVDDGHVVAHQLREPVQRDRDVDGTDDDQLRGAAVRLDEPVAVAARELRAGVGAVDELQLTGREVGPQRRGLLALELREELAVYVAEWLYEHLDVPAAREPDVERYVVGHAERGDAPPPRLEDFLRLVENRTLDAAVRHRAGHLSGLRRGHLRPERPRARAPRLDHRGERDLLARIGPLAQLAQIVESVDVVRGEEVVAVRKRRRHAAGQRLVALGPDERIEPDEAVGGAT